MPLILRSSRRRQMTVFARMRRLIQKMAPYPSLMLLAIPVALVEPLKLLALFIAGRGHWLSGTGMIVAAYAVSLLLVERLFKIVKPKLMMIGWFANCWIRFVGLKDGIFSSMNSGEAGPGAVND